MNDQTKERMHYGIAERGKMHYLEGNHAEALRHFQEAIQMTVKHKSSDVFFQHYTQCVMESLELSGHHQEVIDYCEKMCDYLLEKDLDSDVMKKNYATSRERQAIQFLLLGDEETAKTLLEESSSLLPDSMPLSAAILGWLKRGYRVTEKQLRDVQKKHNYFVVRQDQVKPEMAIDLPNSNNVPSI